MAMDGYGWLWIAMVVRLDAPVVWCFVSPLMVHLRGRSPRLYPICAPRPGARTLAHALAMPPTSTKSPMAVDSATPKLQVAARVIRKTAIR